MEIHISLSYLLKAIEWGGETCNRRGFSCSKKKKNAKWAGCVFITHTVHTYRLQMSESKDEHSSLCLGGCSCFAWYLGCYLGKATAAGTHWSYLAELERGKVSQHRAHLLPHSLSQSLSPGLPEETCLTATLLQTACVPEFMMATYWRPFMLKVILSFPVWLYVWQVVIH